MNAPWTFADLPTLSLPITFVPASDTSSDDVSSLPLGIQISAPSLGESALFSAARRIEQVACS
jgi:Asp-tRNA(Asn)/Glu-tRNA(Gln) amidotransferase A subunit family amidase